MTGRDFVVCGSEELERARERARGDGTGAFCVGVMWEKMKMIKFYLAPFLPSIHNYVRSTMEYCSVGI